MMRLPSAREYAGMPFTERRRWIDRLEQIRLAWLATEAPDPDRRPA